MHIKHQKLQVKKCFILNILTCIHRQYTQTVSITMIISLLNFIHYRDTSSVSDGEMTTTKKYPMPPAKPVDEDDDDEDREEEELEEATTASVESTSLSIFQTTPVHIIPPLVVPTLEPSAPEEHLVYENTDESNEPYEYSISPAENEDIYELDPLPISTTTELYSNTESHVNGNLEQETNTISGYAASEFSENKNTNAEGTASPVDIEDTTEVYFMDY